MNAFDAFIPNWLREGRKILSTKLIMLMNSSTSQDAKQKPVYSLTWRVFTEAKSAEEGIAALYLIQSQRWSL